LEPPDDRVDWLGELVARLFGEHSSDRLHATMVHAH
jgi:hypothetical protein